MTRDKRSCHCNSKECRQKHNNARYQTVLYPKICVHCEKPFEGKYREVNCPECKGKKKDVYKEYTVHDLCIHCGEAHRERKVWFETDYQAKDTVEGVCPECRKLTGKRISESKLGEKNPNWKGGPKERVYKTLSPEERAESKRKISERMRLNNPMKKEEVRAKVSKTIRERIESKELVYVSGKDHHLWRGERKRSFTIRSRLYRAWVKPILARDGFRCIKCGSKDDLEAHHEGVPFRDVVKMFSAKSLEDLSEEEFELVSRQVVCYHIDHVQGITLCKTCHKAVDPLRR